MSTGVIAAGVVIVYTNKLVSSLQLGLVRYFKFASGYIPSQMGAIASVIEW